MTKGRVTPSASIHQRLLNHARESKVPFEIVLTRYVLERILFRLSISDHADSFLLKGAMLFAIWTDRPYRPTRDLDLLVYGDPDPGRLVQVFNDLCSLDVPEDALEFDTSSIMAEPIRHEKNYGGVRVRFTARLGKARIAVQVDVGFGDCVPPPPELVAFPTILDHEPPNVRAYPREVVIAEKLEAMVTLGVANSRMKDFFDICVLARQFNFLGNTLCLAGNATFDRRETQAPKHRPAAFTQEFSTDSAKRKQWEAFQRKNMLNDERLGEFQEVVAEIEVFLWPVLRAVSAGKPLDKSWARGGPWD